MPLGYLLEIVDSVADSSAASELLGTTSMHHLVVGIAPLEPHLEVIIVRAPTSLHPATSGVRIEHRRVTSVS
jgi:hypothetical protein